MRLLKRILAITAFSAAGITFVLFSFPLYRFFHILWMLTNIGPSFHGLSASEAQMTSSVHEVLEYAVSSLLRPTGSARETSIKPQINSTIAEIEALQNIFTCYFNHIPTRAQGHTRPSYGRCNTSVPVTSNVNQGSITNRFSQELAITGAVGMQFVLSQSLLPLSDASAWQYNSPVIDPLTDVRVRDNYWLRHARSADVILLNRGPLPAPASTYASHSGNWSYAKDLPTYLEAIRPNSWEDQPFIYDNKHMQTRLLVNAALHVTLTSFLPSLVQTLNALHHDVNLRHKLVIWHDSHFMHQSHSDKKPRLRRHHFLGDYLLFRGHLQIAEDPWKFYHNAQVYMQNYAIRRLLPHFGIQYLPL
ncbi:hypothetical protein SERLA73DRAFT_159526 [Serpula lacrymans var. lacrymans S7.3]|uniref:Uncharacterized protein n=2 Tax=Serpula lacrymans var. lacrymans TaxID=341189 RepID=F8PT65_SERL3|nr:uncharacterized protein SERLADRAFT_414526 [Serpula lacrymans var. lacrymans S7.9]EGO00895.1 hypothetical protein SERLA73DRAFT_159526 [Serpula lacrymans var. lacrymans S7.3]EGO26510.1 hypothetical protein SERLADRAFT_414526 [Serpula lacrymans var. lacrymans S7.9]